MLTDPKAERKVEKGRLILVEGDDEVNLFEMMITRWSISGLQVLPVGGKYGFKSGLEVALASARDGNIQLSAIGCVRDADDDPDRALQSLSGTLRTLCLPVPGSPGQFSKGSPSVGVFIFPDGQSPGAVEELCWRSVSDTAAGQCSNEYLDCLRRSGGLDSPSEGKTYSHENSVTEQGHHRLKETVDQALILRDRRI